MRLLRFDKSSDSVILYIHGGAYVNQLNLQHSIYCFILSHLLKINIIAPAYPLAPIHDYTESYKLISELYETLIGKYKTVTLMGDSAGGGFVLAFCQYLKKINLKQPDNTIVFSPWGYFIRKLC